MKKRLFILTCVLALWASSLSAQSWAGGFDYHMYKNNMTIYYTIKNASLNKYEIAAFVGYQCRGVSEVVTTTASDGTPISYGYLMVYSNKENDETVTFKFYDKEKGTEDVIPDFSVNFVSTGREGYPTDPIVLDLGLPEVTKGDANGDGNIDAADIVEVVNYLMGKESYLFVAQSADANEDGTVNLADVVTIVNMITGN